MVKYISFFLVYELNQILSKTGQNNVAVKLSQTQYFTITAESKTVQNRDDTFLLTVNRYKII